MANIIFESPRGFDGIPIEDVFLKSREIFLTEEVNAEAALKFGLATNIISD